MTCKPTSQMLFNGDWGDFPNKQFLHNEPIGKFAKMSEPVPVYTACQVVTISEKQENSKMTKIKEKTTMENKLTYTKQGDYLIPNVQIKLVGPIGKYGMMRKAFLKLHNPMMYEDMVLSETLYPHLKEIDETANKRVELLMQQYQEQNPAPDKKTEQMKWVQYMNTIKAQAEETVKFELIYA